MVGEQLAVVEVDALGEVVVLLGAFAQLAGLSDQPVGVLGQVVLDGAVPGRGLGRGRGGGAAARGLVVVAVVRRSGRRRDMVRVPV
jgi:hypothetical protein